MARRAQALKDLRRHDDVADERARCAPLDAPQAVQVAAHTTWPSAGMHCSSLLHPLQEPLLFPALATQTRAPRLFVATTQGAAQGGSGGGGGGGTPGGGGGTPGGGGGMVMVIGT